MKILCFTTMTNPEQRCDPWKEALECYNFYFDQVVTVGEDWPDEFKFDLIGKYFQKVLMKLKVTGFSEWILIIFSRKRFRSFGVRVCKNMKRIQRYFFQYQHN